MTGRVFLATAMVLAAVCGADSWVVNEFPDGRTVAPLEETPAVMRAESVLIDPVPGDWWLSPRMRVRCAFRLENPTSRRLVLTTGFPLQTHFGSTYHATSDSAYYEALSWRAIDIEAADPDSFVPPELDFRASVDGVEAPVRFRFQRQDPESGLMWRPLSAVWKTVIPPEETVRLAVAYTTAWSYRSGSPTNVWWIDYVLRSGITWADDIDSILVRLTVPESIPRPAMEDTLVCSWMPSPPTGEVFGRTVTWRFTDLEPDFDIGMRVLRCQPHYELAPIFLETARHDITWTRDSLAPTAIDAQWTATWQPVPTSVLMEKLSLWVAQRPELCEEAGLDPEHAGELLALESRRLEECRRVVAEAGLDTLLPAFTLRRRWSKEDLYRFAEDPQLHRHYLQLLLAMETIIGGGAPNSVLTSSFYRLLGWCWPGHVTTPAARFQPPPAEAITAEIRRLYALEGDGSQTEQP